MKKNLISVIMGIYNIPSKEILEKSINSILNQTYENFEFIIIDDGSTNETFTWAEEICNGDERVLLIKNEKNMGLVKTLNRCLEHVHGEFIARMDGDDCSQLNRFEKEIEFLKKNDDYSLVCCNVNLFDDNGVWGKRSCPEIINKKDFLFGSPIVHPTIMIRSKDLLEVNGYRDSWETNRTEDYDLFMRLFSAGKKIYTIQECLLDYREDEICYSKRKYKYRINEFVVRLKGFKSLKLYPIGYIYAFKPLIVGLIPQKVLRTFRKNN